MNELVRFLRPRLSDWDGRCLPFVLTPAGNLSKRVKAVVVTARTVCFEALLPTIERPFYSNPASIERETVLHRRIQLERYLCTYLLHVGHSKREGGLPFMHLELWQSTAVALMLVVVEKTDALESRAVAGANSQNDARLFSAPPSIFTTTQPE